MSDVASGQVERIRSRDPDTLEAIVRECLPGLLRSARASGLAPDRAEDAVQSALMTFVQRAPDFDGRARPATWIHGILMRKIMEHRRSSVREAETDDIDIVVEARFDETGRWSRPPAGPVAELARGQFREQLARCLDGIPDVQRLAFNLKEIEGFTTAEICKILDVSANNLGVILYRARNRLRECLETQGFEGSEDAAL